MTDQDIAWLSIEALAARIRAREVLATEVAQSMLRRIERIDPGLHAYARTTPDLALAQAREADARLARGDALGPLHGVPIAVKDLCWTAGIPTAAGTTIIAISSHRWTAPSCAVCARRARCCWACSWSPATCAKTCWCGPGGHSRTAPTGIPGARRFPD